MNKSSLKTFAIWGRNELRNKVEMKLTLLNIKPNEVVVPEIIGDKVEINGRLYSKDSYDSLVRKYKELGWEELVEENAYIWFNRLTALAYMEKNEYIDEKMIYSTSSKIDPDVLDDYMEAGFYDELSSEIQNILHDLKDNHRTEELYTTLVEEKCHELSNIMPFMFNRAGDYSDLLFPSGLLMQDSFLVKLRDAIDESVDEDGLLPVEIIGWLYQFYNSEKKDQVFEGLKKNKKITKESIPAATQLFTPKWIVKYMAENSLGKLAIESLGVSEKLKDNWKYYIEPVKNEELLVENEKLNIEDIKILDPAMGSGHMLTYSFDLLYDIYEDLGWSSKDTVLSILRNNIYGLEIDDRAGMLAGFAIMMKGREKFKRLFRTLSRLDEDEKISLNTLAIQESNIISDQIKNLIDKEDLHNLKYLVNVFYDAKEYGSILKVEKIESEDLKIEIEKLKKAIDSMGQMNIFVGVSSNFSEEIEIIKRLSHQLEVMTKKYDITITNPPYMGGKGYSPTLKKYVEKNYKNSKSDLFAVFIERCGEYTAKDRYTSMITMHSWMFLSSFEKLRKKLVEEKEITSMLHLGTRAFEEIGGEIVQTTSWVTKKRIPIENGIFVRLVDYKNSEWKQDEFKNKENYFQTIQKDFSKIPGSPIAYWVSDREKDEYFKGGLFKEKAQVKKGIDTGKNDLFLKLWYELSNEKFPKFFNIENIINYNWFPYNKGGEYRKWYGNREYLVNWVNNGDNLRSRLTLKSAKPTLRNLNFMFNKGFSWSTVSSSNYSSRFTPEGSLFDNGGCTFFSDDNLNVLGAYSNSKVAKRYFEFLAPTLNFQPGNVGNLLYISGNKDRIIDEITLNCINLAKQEWDSRETSWDFKENQLIVNNSELLIEKSIEVYEINWREKFFEMHSNEEELNRLFIEIYGLQDEMDEKIDLGDITLLKNELVKEGKNKKLILDENGGIQFDRNELVKQFISYAVGCIMGRYSIDKEGLIIANSDDTLEITDNRLLIKGTDGETRHEIENHGFTPDPNGIIPVVHEDIFENDIVHRITEFVKAVYGSENLESNMDFIAEQLGTKKGETPKDTLRRYFMKEFYKDHLQRYKKRPIYWMMNSGKKDGFSALVYMHRYNEDTMGRIRTDYLTKYQETIGSISTIYDRELASDTLTPKERKNVEKKLKEMHLQTDELVKYANEVKHLADMRLGIDLDDGVKVNYTKFSKVMKKVY